MNGKLFKLISLLLTAALLTGLVGCDMLSRDAAEETAEEQPEESAPIVVGETTGEVLQDTYKADRRFSINSQKGASFNPYLTKSAWNLIAGMLAYDTLVTTGTGFEAMPNLVTNWYTEDGWNWTFTVDTTRKFHDGGDMTASDAVYSLEQSVGIARYEKRFSHMTDASVVDTATFTVTLNQPDWQFYKLLTIPCIEAGQYYNDIPSGTGPYKFNASGTFLTRFEDHPDADKLPIRTIYLKHYTRPEDILQAFEDSLLDLVTNSPADASSLGYSRSNLIKYVETTNLHFIGYNMRSSIFSYGPYRQLVTYAVDRDTIVANAFQGSAVAAELPIHPNSAYYPRSVAQGMKYDQDILQTVVTNLGGTDLDQDGVVEFGSIRGEIVFLVCSDSGAKVSAARQIASQLRSVGFAVTMSELGYADYITALEEGQYDMFYGEVKLCSNWDISELIAPGGSLNYGGIQDPAITGYIQTFLASSPADPGALSANAEALYSYIAQNAPITAVCFERMQVLYHRGVLTTIDPTQENIFHDIQDWQVNLE